MPHTPILPRTSLRTALVALALSAAGSAGAEPEPMLRNGFRLEPAAVPVTAIIRGGPPRDGIPALDHPTALPAARADWRDEDRVLGTVAGGEARAYPLAILEWHELVNDTLGGEPILVSYCPLCGSGLVFGRRVAGATRSFGVSGLLYRSDLLMYDRGTESLWSQIAARAVTGPLVGERLRLLRVRVESWGAWRRHHPDSSVLSRETGHDRDYASSPYGDYATSSRTFGTPKPDPRYPPKTRTVGLRVPGQAARAYPAPELLRAGGAIAERFAGHAVRIAYDAERDSFHVEAPPEVEVVEGYWFAWASFHPDTGVFRATGEPAPRARE